MTQEREPNTPADELIVFIRELADAADAQDGTVAVTAVSLRAWADTLDECRYDRDGYDVMLRECRAKLATLKQERTS
jgi:site-specific recombinase